MTRVVIFLAVFFLYSSFVHGASETNVKEFNENYERYLELSAVERWEEALPFAPRFENGAAVKTDDLDHVFNFRITR